jgi:hypothetical protein
MLKQTVTKLSLPIAILSAISSFTSACQATEVTPPTTKTYEVTYENFPNPERGFFVASAPNAAEYLAPLTLEKLQQVRSQGMSTVRRYYVFFNFRNSPISQEYLDFIRNDLKLARQAGVKVIIRFAYNWVGGGPDAPRDRILSHLDQLRPIFAENYDVIAYVQAGFVGFWGEWNRSVNNLMNPEDLRAIVFKYMSVLPKERTIAIRYNKWKKLIFNSNAPLTSKEAFTGTHRARAANNNQCFLASSDDWGTYNTVHDDEIEAEKQYLRADNQYLVQGGETCNSDNEAQPYIGCPNALKDLAKLRFSDLNSEDEKGVNVLQKWKDDGCMPQIQRRLGYRFYLRSSAIPSIVKPGGNFDMNFVIANVGWASPYNSRGLEIIMRHKATRAEYHIRPNYDPRRWMGMSNKQVNVSVGIPTNMPAGDYDIFLNLPDPAPKLYGRPEYSMRLANKDVWEPTTGYNSFLRTVTVDPEATGSDYSGSTFFESR